ncbi:MAG TPA: hypothetical protein VFO65_05665 [Acidimicrobiales bacterium]|nr:hypothetical protein [Acidimicrobiales bacterium]
MDPALSSVVAVVGQVALVLAAGLAYLRRVRVDRPPVGVFNHRDVLLVGVVLVVIPPLYLRLPAAALATVFAVLSTAMVSFALAPLLRPARAFAAAAVLVAADVALAELARESYGWLFDAVNNLALAIVVVGVCAMWVQSGVRARHVAALAGALAVYDVVATTALPLMADLVDRLASLPLTPMLVWGAGDGVVGIGMGDLLLVVVWTMVAEKAFSRRAGLLAAAMGLATITALFLAFWLDLLNSPVPAMVPLGSLMVVHYLVLARRAGRERTTAEYLLAAGT